jgi:uncharacterized membrane protein YesL
MAGFFGFFDYTKPGPGVDKDAQKKNKFALFFELYFRKFWKLITLNIIYFLTCIPIVTIGPATAGFTYVLRNFSREDHAWVTSDYFEHGFKNFKQAFIVSIIDFILLYLGWFSYNFYSQYAEGYLVYGKYIILIMGFIYLFMHFYIYQMMVTFKLSLKQIYKNAFIFAIARLPQNILILILTILVSILFYYYVLIGVLLTPVIVLSTVGFIINFYVYHVIKKYMLDKIPEENGEEQEIEEAEN